MQSNENWELEVSRWDWAFLALIVFLVLGCMVILPLILEYVAY